MRNASLLDSTPLRAARRPDLRCRRLLPRRSDDHRPREKLAAEWSTEAFPLTPEDIDCHGCVCAADQLIGFSRTCNIRQCGIEKGIDSCADCGEYPCEKLDKTPPEAKAGLEGLRHRA